MLKGEPIDREKVEIVEFASLYMQTAHTLGNILGVLPVWLMNALHHLDELDIPSDKRRELENEIGRAIDGATLALQLISLSISWRLAGEGVTLIELMNHVVRVLAPLIRRRNRSIEIESLSDQYASRICAPSLGRIVFHVLIFSMNRMPVDHKLRLLIRETDIAVIADYAGFSSTLHNAFNHETDEDLLSLEYLNLYVALKLAQELHCEIDLTEVDGESAIAIQVQTL